MVRYLFYTIGDLTYQSPLVPLTGSCKYGNEPSNFIQCGEYLHYLGSYSLGKEDSAP